MAIEFDSAGLGANQTGGSPATWTHTCIGDDRAVIVCGSAGRAGGSPSVTSLSATYGGAAMSLLDEITFTGTVVGRIGVFGLLNPPAGENMVSLTQNGSGGTTVVTAGNSLSYNGVSALGDASAEQGAAGPTANFTVSSAPGEVVAQVFNTSSPSDYNQTLRTENPVPGVWVFGDAPGAATVNFSITKFSNIDWRAFAVRLLPIPGLPVKVYQGGAWVQKQMKRWNGTAWVEVNPKVWDGSDWT